MASGINKVILIGRLGADPDSRTMPTSETVVTNVSLATSESWDNKSTGEREEKTQWHRVVFWNRVAEIARDFLSKGSLIYVEGKLESRKFEDKDGIEKYTTEVVVRFPGQLQMLESKKDGGTFNQDNVTKQNTSSNEFVDEEFDDDIPF